MSPDEVQVWRLNLVCAEGRAWVEAGWELLSSDEVARARRIRVGTSRDEMVAGRAALRSLLAAELGCGVREVKFQTGEHGKPALVGGEIDFNVAHSQGMILIALSRAGAVGIDVEDSARIVEAVDVARTVFHPEELRCVRAAEETQRQASFYRIWTRKEAVAKADGRGLMLPPQSFSVFEDMPVVVECHQQNATSCEKNTSDGIIFRSYHGNTYHLYEVDPGIGFIAALALGRQIVSIAQFDIFYPARDPKRGNLVSSVPELV